jgi:small GTP-binding protein
MGDNKKRKNKSKKENEQIDLKTILLGESGVGKTSLIKVITGKQFSENVPATYMNYYVEKTFEINNNNYKIKIWDTIGQEKFRTLTKLFYKDSKIIIFVYDKSIKNTFNELIKYWINEVKETIDDHKYVMGIVGNKDDLEDKENDVDEEEARLFANNINAKFKMVSAKKDGEGFEAFLKELIIDLIEKCNGKIERDIKSVVLNKKNHKKTNNKKCCN